MRRALLYALGFVLVAGPSGADFIQYRPPALTFINSAFTAQAALGSNVAPAIAAANWTCGAGWDCSVAGTLNKNADGIGTAAPNPALSITAGVTYKVVVTVGALTVAGGAAYTLGAQVGSPLTSAATFTDYITARTTGSLIITPYATATRFTITAISVVPLTNATGDLTVEGNLVVDSGTTFNGPLAFGSNANALQVQASNTFLGVNTGAQVTTGTENVGVGTAALYRVTTGYKNIALGGNTLSWLTEGYENVAVGENGLTNLTTGHYNTVVGEGAGAALTDSNNNVAIGATPMHDGTTGTDDNVAIGTSALHKVSGGDYNIGIGTNAGQAVVTGSSNVAIGLNSLYNTTGADNVAIGGQAGRDVTTGNQNTFVGREAGYGTTLATGTNMIGIGFQAQTAASNQISLGNASVTTLLIAGTATVTGDVVVKGSDGNNCTLSFKMGLLTAETCP